MEVILLAIAFIDGVRFALMKSLSTSSKFRTFCKYLRTTATATQTLRWHGEVPGFLREAASTNVGRMGTPEIETGGLQSTPNNTRLFGTSRRAEIVVNLVSSAGILVAIIKLASALIPIHILLPALFMISNWILVQILSLLSDSETTETNEISSRAQDLEPILKHFMVWVTLTILSLPLYVYLTIAALTKTNDRIMDLLLVIRHLGFGLQIFYLTYLYSWAYNLLKHPLKTPFWLFNTSPVLRKGIFKYLTGFSIFFLDSTMFLGPLYLFVWAYSTCVRVSLYWPSGLEILHFTIHQLSFISMGYDVSSRNSFYKKRWAHLRMLAMLSVVL